MVHHALHAQTQTAPHVMLQHALLASMDISFRMGLVCLAVMQLLSQVTLQRVGIALTRIVNNVL